VEEAVFAVYSVAMDDQTKIIDATEVTPASEEAADQASTLVTITNLIQTYRTQIEQNKKELKERRQMVEDALNNDATYHDQAEKVKEANKVKLATKKQILAQPALREQTEKAKELTEELKAAKEALSDYLQQYRQLTGSNQFEDAAGEVLDIVYSARLVPPSSR
jgi:hypothetical protein